MEKFVCSLHRVENLFCSNRALGREARDMKFVAANVAQDQFVGPRVVTADFAPRCLEKLHKFLLLCVCVRVRVRVCVCACVRARVDACMHA